MTQDTVKIWFMEFFSPGRLWAALTVVLLIIGYLVLLRLKRNRGIRYTQTGIVGAVLPRQSQWRRHIAVIATLLSLLSITVAWARPAGEEKVPRQRATVVIILDQSYSMEATDIEPNRFDASKQAALGFVDSLPAGYNVAVVGMSATPSLLSPATTDRAAVKRAIELMEMAPGTSIGDGIVTAVNAAKTAPGSEDDQDAPPAIAVMLSDGEQTTGDVDPLQAAQQAVDIKMPIYTIAYGTLNGYVDIDGKRENVAPDTETLEKISDATGGQSLDAKSADQLNNVYEKMKSEVTYETVKKEVTARWAAIALAFALIASLGAVSMAARWP